MFRVLHVLDHSLPLHSGYTFRTRAILKAQQAMGFAVRGVTGLRHAAELRAMAGPDAAIDQRPVEEADGLLFHRTPGEAGGPPGLREWREIGRLADAIERVCRDWRPDVLHAHSPALCGEAALRAASRLGIPLVYEIRAFWEDAAVGNGKGREGSARYRLTRAMENHVVSRADAVVTICEGLRADLIARGCDGSAISVMPNGVDLALFGTPAPRDAALAAQLGLGSGPVIGFIGSFYDYEGIDDLIAAMPALVACQPDARLLLVGGGPCMAALKAQAEASPAAQAIRFAGRVPHHEVERYYALADVMAYPRKRSRLTDLVTPLKPLEAMAQGKLVAASDVGGHRELIADGITGRLFAPDDPAACADALARLLDERRAWDGYRAAGRAHVETRHDWARNAERYQDVYQKSARREAAIRAARRLSGQPPGKRGETVLAKPQRQQEKQKHRQPPLSRHPLFPAIVALWFAAFVGLGSLALSTSLIERAVLATGLDAAIPAAAPPLGMTARLLLALALGAVGGAIGWGAAWRLARAHDAPAPKVFSVRDADLDDQALPWPSSDEPHADAEPAGPILDPASLAAESADHAPASEAAPEPAPEPTAAERIASADLRALSPVELVERLAIALKHRQERRGTMVAAGEPRESAPALGEVSEDVSRSERPVLHFPDFGERQHARLALSASAPPPQETEKALRKALAELQRMSGRG